MRALVLSITNLKQVYFVKHVDHQYLHFNSDHPFHNKNATAYSQGLRIKRLWSSPWTLKKHLKNLKTWFCNRWCPQKAADAQIKRVTEKRLDEVFERLNIRETGVLLVVTYHPRFHNLSPIIRKYFTFLYAEEKGKGVFTPAPFVSFRSGKYWPYCAR